MHTRKSSDMTVAAQARRTLALIAAAAAAVAAPAAARAQAAPAGAARVASVAVSGAERTAPDAVASFLGLRPGAALPGSEETLRQKLLKSGVFSEAEVAFGPGDGGTRVDVRVKDKWTLLAIPMASFNEGEWYAGVAAIDFNAFGTMKGIGVVGAYGSRRFQGAVRYDDKNFFGSPLGFSVGFMAQRRDQAVLDAAAAKEGSFRETSAAAFLEFSFPVAAGVKPALAVKGSASAFDEQAGRGGLAPAAPLPAESAFAATEAKIELDFTELRGVFAFGPKVLASAEYAVPLRGDLGYASVAGNATFVAPAFLGGAVTAYAQGEWGNRALPFSAELRGRAFRVLQGGVRAPRYAGGSLELELPFVSNEVVAATVDLAFEGGACEIPLDGGPRFGAFWGLAGGVRLYLKGVAIPAIGLDVGWNAPEGRPSFGLNVGFQM